MNKPPPPSNKPPPLINPHPRMLSKNKPPWGFIRGFTVFSLIRTNKNINIIAFTLEDSRKIDPPGRAIQSGVTG